MRKKTNQRRALSTITPFSIEKSSVGSPLIFQARILIGSPRVSFREKTGEHVIFFSWIFLKSILDAALDYSFTHSNMKKAEVKKNKKWNYFANLGPFSSTISSECRSESSQVSNDTGWNQHIPSQVIVDGLKQLRSFGPPEIIPWNYFSKITIGKLW